MSASDWLRQAPRVPLELRSALIAGGFGLGPLHQGLIKNTHEVQLGNAKLRTIGKAKLNTNEPIIRSCSATSGKDVKE